MKIESTKIIEFYQELLKKGLGQTDAVDKTMSHFEQLGMRWVEVLNVLLSFINGFKDVG